MASFRLRVVAVLAASVAALHFGDVLAQASSAELAAYMSGLRIDRSMLAGSLAPSPRSAMRLEGNGDSDYLVGGDGSDYIDVLDGSIWNDTLFGGNTDQGDTSDYDRGKWDFWVLTGATDTNLGMDKRL